MEIPKQFDSAEAEPRLYDFWLKKQIFTADTTSSKKKFVMMMPPPNVTGVLHIGHALVCTIEDTITRRERMLGKNTLWLPGTDHAGIATQMVVERNLKKETGKSRHDLGREKFLEKVWEWKELSQGTILSQLKLIGVSADWTRLKFTLDDDLSRAVREAFVRLYKDKLIYRDKRMIQWCPRCLTAVSDLEVKHVAKKGHLWTIKYLHSEDPSKYLTVATTRPETIFGDTGVAVHPDDKRYTAFKNQKVIVPLIDRKVPVILDECIEMGFGTGALKVTPAHDMADFEIGTRHGLEFIDTLDDRAHLTEVVGPHYQGLSREKAREKAVEDLKSQGLLVKVEEIQHNIGQCDRCGTNIEPKLSLQWFVRAKELAGPAIKAVENKELKIIPAEWEKTYFEWMRNIQPWCISRQLWWGHRIPVWYCGDCEKETCEIQDPKECPHCRSKKMTQDPDVLDTWFSSGLWPISTLGWPDTTQDLKTFYPTDVLETGFDILFFWVARMVMLCHRMTGQIPFHTVYLHPMVRDEFGQKMSKTKNNVKDPLDIIREKGADALRFTLASMAVHGRDVLLSDARIDGYRHFVNKIWNASRFVLLHFSDIQKENKDTKNEVNRWLWSRLNKTKKEVNRAFEEYRFYEAAEKLYHFFWHEYCDWFIEFIKSPHEIESRKQNGESTAIQVLEEALRLLHPLMPFVTEEIWQNLPLKEKSVSIAVSNYPQFDAKGVFEDSESRIERVIKIVEAIRTKRGENNLPPDVKLSVTLSMALEVQKEVAPSEALIAKLVGAKEVHFNQEVGKQVPATLLVALEDVEIRIPRGDLIDEKAEVEKSKKELESLRQQYATALAKLNNPSFADQAPAKVVEGVRERKAILEKQIQSIEAYLKDLKPSP